MRIPHIYCNTSIELGLSFTLDWAKSHHLINVLRLQSEHPVTLFCNNGAAYQGYIAQIKRDQVSVLATKKLDLHQESPLSITLCQSLCKGEKMDWVVQKATELGVTKIIPIITERCDMRIPHQKIAKKLAHWQSIAISAAEQSRRQALPHINAPLSLTDLLEYHKESGPLLVMTLTGGSSLTSIEPRPSQCQILIGPEGGLSEAEYQLLTETQANLVQLGPRILRTETAAITTISLCQMIWGDLHPGDN